MAGFLVKTRNNSDPKGKPRVYFTCHPGDFEQCFYQITNDILHFRDCAIYYTEDMTASIEEGDMDPTLGYMDLFVVPITYELLTTPNRALRVDIPYAKNAHISVLPIFMESDEKLNKLYAECEALAGCQYLTRQSKDPTEKRYTDKLSAYLEAVLVGDAMAERVRAAFDGYIFLSYRKKDRRYANELMKRIHEIPEFRNVAIWYDEFLTPGEDFSENIEKVMRSCSLFTLVVTPNILEEPNFVADTEYPMAMEAVMCVIPAEMEKTDRAALVAKFRDIPACINPDDPVQLTERMLEHLSRERVLHVDAAEQNFLIGMAYLKGIDVEIDRKRGIALITEAAEAGYVEAVEKLFGLYSGKEGSGFRSHSRAIPWGEKLVEIRAEEWGWEHPNTQILLAELAASYSEDGNSAYAKELLERVYRSRCQTLGEKHPHAITAIHNLAVEYAKLGQYEKALELDQTAYTLRCEVLGEAHPETLPVLQSISQIYFDLGHMEMCLELLEKAYTQSRTALGEVHPTTIRILEEFAVRCHQNGDSQRAIGLLETAIPIYKKELGETEHATYLRIRGLADIYLDIGDVDAASRYLDPLIEQKVKSGGWRSAAYLIQVYDDHGFKAYANEEYEKAALCWGKTHDLNCRCFGISAEESQSTFRSLLELLPDVSGAVKQALLEQVKTMLVGLCDTDHGDLRTRLTEENWVEMEHTFGQAFKQETPEIRAAYGVLLFDCMYYYRGNQDKKTEAQMTELLNLLPQVTGAAQEEILERLYQMLMVLRDQVQFGSFQGTTVGGLKLMMKLLRLYRTYGRKQKRIALLEMFRELCTLCCSADAPVFAVLEEMLTEDQALPD